FRHGFRSLYKNVEIIQEYDEGLPFIYCDGNQMKQVFMNIIKNAIEAMPNGGIIEIQISCHNFHSVRLTFIDQGVGISAERIKHIGEPYFSTKEKGTGLGLMIT
ncbi:ATP-binding protein, partial [Heyndrickxia ginsengihumi]|uniref:ATP-binding protein n=1 Tax=Heyndrickxia ginsengihumi TaxID=363870 RepID=UPI003D2038C6